MMVFTAVVSWQSYVRAQESAADLSNGIGRHGEWRQWFRLWGRLLEAGYRGLRGILGAVEGRLRRERKELVQDDGDGRRRIRFMCLRREQEPWPCGGGQPAAITSWLARYNAGHGDRHARPMVQQQLACGSLVPTVPDANSWQSFPSSVRVGSLRFAARFWTRFLTNVQAMTSLRAAG